MSLRFRWTVGLLASAMLGLSTASAEELSGYSGEELFNRFCASCHGSGGEGDGPVAPFFKLHPPDLSRIARRHGGEFPAEKIRRIVDGRENIPPHGARSMPVWGTEFTTAEGDTPEGRKRAQELIARLVDYLESIQKP